MRRAGRYRRLASRQGWRTLAHQLALDVSGALESRRVPVLPLHVDIEPNNYCNYKCDHCQVTHWSKPRVDLDAASLGGILDQFPRLLEVKLQGMGEPLLNRQTLPMLAVLKERGIATEMITNGSVMTDHVRDRLAALGTRVAFSIDGASAEVFEAIRVKSRFDKVVENVRRLVAARTDPGQVMEARTVISRVNMHELPAIVGLVADLGLDRMTVQTVLTGWGKEAMEGVNSGKRIDEQSALDDAVREARGVARDRGLELVISDTDKYSSRRHCRWPWTGAYISSAGDVVPCCILADADTVSMGNVFEQPFREIWNNDAYRTLRRRIADDDLPDYCRSCYDSRTSTDVQRQAAKAPQRIIPLAVIKE